MTPTCSSFGSNVADGYCDDHLNSRTCDFDGGDCCLQTAKSKERCTECKCALDEEIVSTEGPNPIITTTSPKEVKNYGEICDVEGDQATCYPTGAIQFGAKSSKAKVMKCILVYWRFSDNHKIQSFEVKRLKLCITIIQLQTNYVDKSNDETNQFPIG